MIQEIYENIKNYSVDMDYQPLEICFHLRPPIFIGSPFIHLDSIVNYLCLRDALGELFYSLPTEEIINTENLLLPIKKTGDVYHSSIAWFNKPYLYRDIYYKRFTDNEYYKVMDSKKIKGKLHLDRGHFKDFMINMPFILTDKAVFYANADKGELERLLSNLVSIGKKNSINTCNITKISFKELDVDYSFYKEGEIMRTIPTDLKLPISVTPGMCFSIQAYKPPYWNKNSVKMCYTPKNQLEEVL